MPLRFLTILLATVPLLADGPYFEGNRSLLDQYVAAAKAQRLKLEGATMQVDIRAEVPRLNQKGHLRAMRKIASLGRITYDAIRFDGDKSIRNNVIAKYLAAETEASEPGAPSLAVTPDNYKFKYKGERQLDGRRVHLFEIKPLKKRAGLFQGELWIDSTTFLPLREAGKLVKTPSIFLKRVRFVRDYRIEGDLALPAQFRSEVDTRVAGHCTLIVAYSGYSFGPTRAGSVIADNP
ncbi:MAG: hypothetical protein ACKV22_10605 [Bryobacteraceae bacterium]